MIVGIVFVEDADELLVLVGQRPQLLAEPAEQRPLDVPQSGQKFVTYPRHAHNRIDLSDKKAKNTQLEP